MKGAVLSDAEQQSDVHWLMQSNEQWARAGGVGTRGACRARGRRAFATEAWNPHPIQGGALRP